MSDRLEVLALNIGEPVLTMAANLAAMSDELASSDAPRRVMADSALADLDGALATLAVQAQGVRTAIAALG